MAFSSFSNSGSTPGGTSQAQNGPDLEDIQTSGLGFHAINGDVQVQLSTAWPNSQLPPATSSLLSVASKRGLIAAAGPDSLVIASTQRLRDAYEAKEGKKVRQFQPEVSIPMPMRISQVAFSADESSLVLSAENGGGLAVYDVQSLLANNTKTAFEISTNGQALRALVPNPNPKMAELFAVVDTNGNLMIANLKERNFIQSANGQTLKDAVSCVSWSAKGKQLVAGLADGTAHQLEPKEGLKQIIPRPPSLNNNEFVSSMTWLENNAFMVAHTPQKGENGMAPSSTYHIVTRSPSPGSFTYTFQKISDPAGPFSGVERGTPHQFVQRIRKFPPNLEDLLIIGSSASTDIGMFSKCTTPLTSDKPADRVSNVFTFTETNDDSRRAVLPMSASMDDTSPIGVALDFSSTKKVWRPIPSDDMDESPTPIPAFLVLNNEGVLGYWWIIYTESLRLGTVCPGMGGTAAGTGMQSSPAPVQQPTSPAFGGKPAFGQPTFGASAVQQPTAPAFGQPTFGASAVPSFGQPTMGAGAAKPAFGAPSAFGASGVASGAGQKASVWGTPAPSTSSGPSSTAPAFGSATTLGGGGAFGKPAFGSPSTPSAFGSANVPGQKSSPWGSASTTTGATFGQAGGTKPITPFGTTSSPGAVAPATGGFASFATQGGFAATNHLQSATGSVFGNSNSFASPNTPSVFGTTPQTENKPAVSAFGSTASTSNPSPFGKPSDSNSTPNVFASGGFKLGTTFAADPKAKDDVADKSDTGGAMFGSNFGGALGASSSTPAVQSPVSTETDMDASEAAVEKPGLTSSTPSATPQAQKFSFPSANTTKPTSPLKESTTPVSTPAPPNFVFPAAGSGTTSSTTPGPAKLTFPSSTTGGNSLFGIPASTTPTSIKPASAGFSFGQPAAPAFGFANLGKTTTTSEPETSAIPEPPSITKTLPIPKLVKEEPDTETSGISGHVPEPPLPPDPTSKSSFLVGDSSSSSSEADVPSPSGTVSKSEPRLPSSPEANSPKNTTADITAPSDVAEGPSDEDDGDGFESEEDGSNTHTRSENSRSERELSEDASEGSGEDVAKDLSPTSDTQQTPGFTPQTSSIAGSKTLTSETSMFQKINMPGQQAAPSRPLFGEVAANVPLLPPPSKTKGPQSPRSPSPIRGAIPGRMLRPESSRSVSAPGVASNLLGSSQRLGQKPPGQTTSTFSLTQDQQQSEERRRQDAKARQEAEETQALVDEDDDSMQKYLAEGIEPTRTLDEFVAHTNTESFNTNTAIAAQVEALYRDINSMIDTLGVNAKALKAFMMGHNDQYKEDDRTKDDLDDEEDWCLSEIDALSFMVGSTMMRDLQGGRIKDVSHTLQTCSELQKDLTKLRGMRRDIKKIVDTHRDPEQLAAARGQPLSTDQAVQQHDLRKDFTRFQKLLSEAEGSLAVFKTRIVSQASSNGKANGQATPTVEAVMRTITKMTSMAEKRSGDIDVLENQMRKLRFGSTDPARSREGSPYTTPQPNRSLRQSGTYGFSYTPDSAARNMQASFRSSTGSSFASPGPRKKLSGYTNEEKLLLKTKLARRKEVLGQLKSALEKSGTNVRLMNE